MTVDLITTTDPEAAAFFADARLALAPKPAPPAPPKPEFELPADWPITPHHHGPTLTRTELHARRGHALRVSYDWTDGRQAMWVGRWRDADWSILQGYEGRPASMLTTAYTWDGCWRFPPRAPRHPRAAGPAHPPVRAGSPPSAHPFGDHMSTTSPATGLVYPSGATVVLGPDAPRDEWHAVRKTGIGGSDIAAICGLNPYTSPLEIWLKKTGQTVPPRDDSVLSEAALMGHALEPVIATRFTAITGLIAYENPGTLRMPDVPWALVNLDRTTEEDGLPGVIELKSRSSYALNDWIDEPPIDVQVQTQWQLLVTGWSFGYTAALIGGQRTIVHRIERDEQLIDDLLAIGAEFWGWVTTGTQPPLDGSHATGQLLDRIHAKPGRKDVIADPAEVDRWLAIRRTAKEQLAAAEIAITEADNHLKAIAGDGTDVYVRGELAYTWRPRKGQISWKAAALELDPDLDPEPYRGEPTRVLNIPTENQ